MRRPAVTYAQFASAEEGAIKDVEGPAWKPFVIVDRTGTQQDQIGTFRVESGTGSGTMIAQFSVVPAPMGVESETEFLLSVDAQVFKG